MENIYEYLDFRAYLSAMLQAKKQSREGMSLRAVAKYVKLSPAHLSSVLAGKKSLSEGAGLKLSKFFKLRPDEEEYFLLLVSFSNSEGVMKNLLLKKIKSMSAKNKMIKKNNIHDLGGAGWEYLYILVALDLIPDDQDFVLKMSKNLHLTKEATINILNDLLRAGLVSKKRERYSRTEKKVVFESNHANQTIKNIHEGFLKKSIELLYEKAPSERFSATEFILISEKNFEKAKNLSNEYLNELSGFFEVDSGDAKVMGISLHLNFL